MIIPIDRNSDKGKVTFRRLILSKQLYLHGLDHSRQYSALDKMIAVHNFHNAIEITLRAIILHYEIRLEKELNITFEVMLNEIVSHNNFKDDSIKLPYRREIRNLNELRNMVQHHAVEPESATMEDWRVFSKKFLVRTYEQYFDISFDNLSPVDFINNEPLRSILKDATANLDDANWERAIVQSKVAFNHASMSIVRFLPYNSSVPSLKRLLSCHPQALSGYSSTDLNLLKWEFEEIDKIFKEIYKHVNEKQLYSAILTSGVSISDLKRYNKTPPAVELSIAGTPVVFGEGSCSEEDAQWIYNFVLESIIKWQLLGLEPVAETDV